MFIIITFRHFPQNIISWQYVYNLDVQSSILYIHARFLIVYINYSLYFSHFFIIFFYFTVFFSVYKITMQSPLLRKFIFTQEAYIWKATSLTLMNTRT